MGQREYVISIEGDEQYRTAYRGQAKAFYNVVDEIFERDVDGLRKQLIQVEADGWNSKLLFQDIIHCPKEKPDWEKEEDLIEEQEEEPDEEQTVRRGFHRWWDENTNTTTVKNNWPWGGDSEPVAGNGVEN